MRRTTYSLLGTAILVFAVTASTANAADPKFLGYLSNKSGQLWAYPDASGRWCREDAALSVLLTPQLTYVQVGQALHTIGAQFAKECKLAVSAKVAAYNPDRSVAGPSVTITKDNNWLPAPAAPAVPPPAAPTAAQAPTQPTAQAAAVVPPPVAAPTANTQVGQPVQLVPAAHASEPAAAPAVAPSPQAVPLPRDLDYWSGMLRAVRANPALLEDNTALRLWAFHRFQSEYQQVQNQEFKLQPVLDRAKKDLTDTMAQTDPDHITVVLNNNFGTYDFNKQIFPVTVGWQININRPCCFNGGPPANFVVNLSDAEAVTGLPMGPDEAQAFTLRRTRFGYVNRNIFISLTIRLDQTGFQSDGWGNAAAVGTIDGIGFYADDHLKEPLYTVGSEEFAKWREAKAAEQAAAEKEKAKQEAEMRHQRAIVLRDQTIHSLSNTSTSVRLANFISAGDINYFNRLNNLREARASALISGKAVAVTMLLQADSSGRRQVAATWPAKLEVTLAEGLPDLKSSGWYLVRGLLNVPDNGMLPPAQIMAQEVYACTQPKCAEAADATAIVDRKLAGAN